MERERQELRHSLEAYGLSPELEQMPLMEETGNMIMRARSDMGLMVT